MPEVKGNVVIPHKTLGAYFGLMLLGAIALLGPPVWGNRDKNNSLENQIKNDQIRFNDYKENQERRTAFLENVITQQNAQIAQKQDELLRKQNDALVKIEKVLTSEDLFWTWIKGNQK